MYYFYAQQVPASQNKKDLLNILDRVPTFVQTLQFTVKDHTVGKDATFVKVDHVIRETKNLMSVINKVVSKCFECATKVNVRLWTDVNAFLLYACVTLLNFIYSLYVILAILF